MATKLEDNYRRSNIIQPGAHPEFEKKVTPLEKVQNAFKQVTGGLTRAINSSGNKRSPSTVNDRSHPKGPTAEELEAIARKYVDRK